MLIASIIPSIILLLSFIIVILIIKNTINHKLNKIKGNTIDFNKFLQYKDDILYVDGEKTTSLTTLALKIQQHVGELVDDNSTIENFEEL